MAECINLQYPALLFNVSNNTESSKDKDILCCHLQAMLLSQHSCHFGYGAAKMDSICSLECSDESLQWLGREYKEDERGYVFMVRWNFTRILVWNPYPINGNLSALSYIV